MLELWERKCGGVVLRPTGVRGPGGEGSSPQKVREKYKEVTEKSFRSWMLDLSDVTTDGKGQRHQLWVVLAPIYEMQYIKNPRYLPVDEDCTEIPRLKPREASTELKAATVKLRNNYEKQQAQ